MTAKPSIAPIELLKRGRSNQLVVIIHGWLGSPDKMEDICKSVKKKLPDADIVVPKYSATFFSNIDPLRIAEVIEDFISEVVMKRNNHTVSPEDKYQKIILIGNSVGALLVKQIYLLGRGVTDSFHKGIISRQKLQPKEWVKNPVQIILLAGMNRGWNIQHRQSGVPLYYWLATYLLYLICSFLNIGKFILATQRGSPFVANMRVRWSLMKLTSNISIPEPEVYQLLGTLDSVVSEDDHTDILINANFILIQLIETNHKDIIKFDDSYFGRRRQEIFENVLIQGFNQLEKYYYNENERIFAKQDIKPEEHVTFIVHGIRDSGSWMPRLAAKFQEISPEIAILSARYSYFPMGAFLILNRRQKYVRRFMDLYTEAVAKNPAVKVSYVGHSNGTYILASALDRYTSISIHNVVFAGSVVEREYHWDEWFNTYRVVAIQNYIAEKDWVVAIFPRFFELLKELFGPTINDIGSAGFNGFTAPQANRYEVIVKGKHFGALIPENHSAIVSFIDKEVSSTPSSLIVNDVNPKLKFFSSLCWLIWFTLLALMLLIGTLFVCLLTTFIILPIKISILIYIAFVWVILETV